MGILDTWIASLGAGSTLLLATVIAIALGLRHATDPDHLSAVTTLVAAADTPRPGPAARLGLAWGAGHATTLFVFGLPIVIAARYLPESAQQAAEAAVGVMIIVLALRLIMRWRSGAFAHLAHHAVSPHVHGVQRAPARTAASAYGIGLVHGMGGSAGVGVLLLSSIHDRSLAVVALLLFSVCTALSMACCSGLVGMLLSRRSVATRFARLAPVLGAASLAFGAWYVGGALTLVPYPL